MAASNGLVSQHKDKTLGISVTLERSHQYVRGNKQTPETGYSANAYVSIPLQDETRPIEEVLKDPETVKSIMQQIEKNVALQVKERDSFVKD